MKRFLSVVLAIIVLVTMLPVSVFATEPAAGDSLEWDNPGSLKLTKTATADPQDAYSFTVTLTIEGKDKASASPADVVILIDQSNSMSDMDMFRAKVAAKTMIDSLMPNSYSQTQVAVVPYGTRARDALLGGFVDYTKKVQLEREIDKLGIPYNNSTNIQDAIHSARSLLAAQPSTHQKFIVVLSDGAPTQSFKATRNSAVAYDGFLEAQINFGGIIWPDWRPFKDNFRITEFDYSTMLGDGGSYELGRYEKYYADTNRKFYVDDNGIATISEAYLAKAEGATIYSIGLGLGTTGTAYYTMLNCATSVAHVKNATDNSELQKIFSDIAGEISNAATNGVVTDPMGEYFDYVAGTVTTSNGVTPTFNSSSETFTWEVGTITEGTPVTMSYKVTVPEDKKALLQNNDPNQLYPTNLRTYLTYTDVYGTENSVKDFPIPEVPLPNDRGTITIKGYLVNEDGVLVAPNGSLLTDAADAQRYDLAAPVGEAVRYVNPYDGPLKGSYAFYFNGTAGYRPSYYTVPVFDTPTGYVLYNPSQTTTNVTVGADNVNAIAWFPFVKLQYGDLQVSHKIGSADAVIDAQQSQEDLDIDTPVTVNALAADDSSLNGHVLSEVWINGVKQATAAQTVNTTITTDPTTVLFVYAAKSNLSVDIRYVDQAKVKPDGTYAEADDISTKIIRTGTFDTAYEVTEKIIPGYDFVRTDDLNNGKFADPSQTVYVVYKAREDTAYKVNHFKQVSSATGELSYPRIPNKVEDKTGTTGGQTEAAAWQPFLTEGYVLAGAITQQVIKGDGSTEINVYYNLVAHNVTYDANGGSNPPVDADTYYNGETVTVKSEAGMTFAGHTFDGWYTAAQGGTEYNSTFTMPNNNVTLYAHWRANNYPVKVEYHLGTANGPSAGATVTLADEYAFGTTLASIVDADPAVVEADLYYDTHKAEYGHGVIQSPGAATVGAGENIIIVVYPQLEMVNVDFVIVGDENNPLPSTQRFVVGGTATDPTDLPSLPEGKVLDGWYTDEDCTVEYNFSTAVTTDITLYAKLVQTYSVTYDANGGSNPPQDNDSYTEGATVTVLGQGDMTNGNMVFDGWFTAAEGGSEYGSSFLMPANDVTLYAHWRANTYPVKVEYHLGTANGPSAGATVTLADEYAFGTTLASIVDADPAVVEADLYYDTHKAEYGHGVIQSPGAATVGAGENIIIVVYPQLEMVNVDFVIVGDENNPLPSTQRFVVGGTATDPTDLPSLPEGKVLDGWYTDEDCTVEYNFSTAVTTDITLYAKLEQTYSVTYDANGGSNPPQDNDSYTEGATVTVLGQGDMANGDMVFDGWFTAAEGGSEYGSSFLMPADDVTLYAHWSNPVPEEISYTIVYYYDGQLDETKTENLSGAIGDVIEDYPNKDEDGKYIEDPDTPYENFPLTLAEEMQDSEIRVYYITNENPEADGTIEIDHVYRYNSNSHTVNEEKNADFGEIDIHDLLKLRSPKDKKIYKYVSASVVRVKLDGEEELTEKMEELDEEALPEEGEDTEGSGTEGSGEGGSGEGSSSEGSSSEGSSSEGSSSEGSSSEGSGTEGGSSEGSSSEGGSTEGSGTEGSGTEGSGSEGGSTEGGSTEGSSSEGSGTEGGSTTEGSGTEGGGSEGGSTEGSGSEGGSGEGGSGGSVHSGVIGSDVKSDVVGANDEGVDQNKGKNNDLQIIVEKAEPERVVLDGDTFIFEEGYAYTVTINYKRTSSTPGGGGGGGNDDDDDPDNTPTTTIPDEPVPLAPVPNLVTIIDEEVPLGALPKSGGNGVKTAGQVGFLGLVVGSLLKLFKKED